MKKLIQTVQFVTWRRIYVLVVSVKDAAGVVVRLSHVVLDVRDGE